MLKLPFRMECEPYVKLADFFRQKLGNIVLGDARVEADWSEKNKFTISNFAEGAQDFKLAFPEGLVPSPDLAAGAIQLILRSQSAKENAKVAE